MFVFIHIPKTAGTTLGTILRRGFGPGYIPLYDSAKHDFFSNEECRAAATFFTEAKCIASHDFAAPLAQPEGVDVTYEPLTVLRHPADRVLSLYHYQRRASEHDSRHPFARLPFDEYLKKSIERDMERSDGKFSHVANTQAYMLGRGQAIDETMKQMEEDFFFVGLTERFDESLLVLRKKFAERGYDIGFHYLPQKTGRRLSAKLCLPPASYDDLMQLNHLDLQIWEHARKQLDHCIQEYGPAFAEDLAVFRKRQRRWRCLAQPVDIILRAVRVEDRTIRRFLRAYVP